MNLKKIVILSGLGLSLMAGAHAHEAHHEHHALALYLNRYNHPLSAMDTLPSVPITR